MTKVGNAQIVDMTVYRKCAINGYFGGLFAGSALTLEVLLLRP